MMKHFKAKESPVPCKLNIVITMFSNYLTPMNIPPSRFEWKNYRTEAEGMEAIVAHLKNELKRVGLPEALTIHRTTDDGSLLTMRDDVKSPFFLRGNCDLILTGIDFAQDDT